MLLLDFFRNVYFPRNLRGRSHNSVRLYELCIMQFTRSLARPPTVADLTESNVYAHLARRHAVAPATRNKELGQLLALWRFATRRKLLDNWPDIPEEPEPERTPIAWMPDELAKLMQAAKRAEGAVGDVPAKLWWPTMLHLMLDTGERIGAIRETRWNWVSGDALRVPAEARKGKTRDRIYRISPGTIASINSLRPYSGSSDYVLPWPYVPTYLHAKFRVIVESAGLPTGRKYQTHCLRKTVGSAAHAAGMNAQDVLDHSTRRDTMRYLDPRLMPHRQACDVLAEYLANPSRPGEDDAKRTG